MQVEDGQKSRSVKLIRSLGRAPKVVRKGRVPLPTQCNPHLCNCMLMFMCVCIYTCNAYVYIETYAGICKYLYTHTHTHTPTFLCITICLSIYAWPYSPQRGATPRILWLPFLWRMRGFMAPILPPAMHFPPKISPK